MTGHELGDYPNLTDVIEEHARVTSPNRGTTKDLLPGFNLSVSKLAQKAPEPLPTVALVSDRLVFDIFD